MNCVEASRKIPRISELPGTQWSFSYTLILQKKKQAHIFLWSAVRNESWNSVECSRSMRKRRTDFFRILFFSPGTTSGKLPLLHYFHGGFHCFHWKLSRTAPRKLPWKLHVDTSTETFALGTPTEFATTKQAGSFHCLHGRASTASTEDSTASCRSMEASPWNWYIGTITKPVIAGIQTAFEATTQKERVSFNALSPVLMMGPACSTGNDSDPHITALTPWRSSRYNSGRDPLPLHNMGV